MTGDAALFADFERRVLTVADGSAGYREFVGEQRLAELVRATHLSRGRTTSVRIAVSKSIKAESDELSPNQRLVLLAARTIVRRVVERGHEAILAGVGVSFAAARVAKLLLDDQDRKVEVMVETGLADLECGETAHPFLLAWANMAQAGRLSSVEDVLGTLTCGAYNRCLGVVGAAEIDARGDINSTRLASGDLLVGSGGASDIASSCSEVVAVVRCEPARLVPRVHYVTSSGRAIWHIATDRCVLSRSRKGEAWTVGDVYPERATLPDVLAFLRTRCRFPELDDTGSSWAEPPTPLELEALAAVGERPEAKAGIQRRAGEA